MPSACLPSPSISSSSTRHIICATARAEATSWSTGSTSAFCCSCRQRRFRNDLTELYHLLPCPKPGIFKTPKEFRAAHVAAGNPRQPANPERLRELMRGAMIRNTRAVVALKLPRRHAMTVWVEGTQSERDAYRDLGNEVRRLAGEAGADRNRLALRHLLAAAGSSPAAAAAALARSAAHRPDEPA